MSRNSSELYVATLIGVDAFANSVSDVLGLNTIADAKSGVEVIRGFNATMTIRAAAAKLFCDLDYLISPVSPVVNFGAELAAPINDPDRPFEHIAYTVPWNMAENPAISINGGYDASGFPIGVQIIGRRFDDIGVLGMAKTFEGLRGEQRPWPSVPGK